MIGTVPLCRVMNKLTPAFGRLFFKLAPTAGKFLLDKNIVPASVCPSKVEPSYFSGGRVRALRYGEIKRLATDFIEGAARVRDAGCDGVYLHAAHGYLIQQFISPYTNRRTDEYGGSFENRMRFLAEIIGGIKEKCPDFPIVVRLSVDEMYGKIGRPDIGYGLADGVKTAEYIEKLGADALDVSCASYDAFNYWLEPPSFVTGWRTDMIKAVKAAVNIPVIAVNLLRSPDDAERQLSTGVSDFAALGRPHIADPRFAAKAYSGHEKEIKRCICCLYCFESMQRNAFFGGHGECSVNPLLGRENLSLKKDGGGRRVVIAGAGVAGLTAAELLSLRGFEVTVYEKADKPGGQVALAANQMSKERIGMCVEDLEYAAKLNGAKILYGTAATAEITEHLAPYAVIVATGGTPLIPKNIDGIDSPFVYPSPAVFDGRFAPENQRIAVVGSGMTGLDAALILAQKNRVTVIEMADRPAPGMWMQHPDDILPKLKELGAEILTSLRLVKIEDGGVIAEHTKTGVQTKIAADATVLAMGVRPENALYNELKNKRANVFVIGDALKSGRIADATRSAFEVVMKL
jgi:2,4-dienoyl-CoA reductase-like NADH-dependent reductase (Old Yellow Enzyme family)/thioredoxin reductase